MAFQMVLPEEALLTAWTRVSAYLAMTAVCVRTQMSLVKESLVTNTAVKLVFTDVQFLVFGVTGVGEEELAADFARLVRRQLGFGADG